MNIIIETYLNVFILYDEYYYDISLVNLWLMIFLTTSKYKCVSFYYFIIFNIFLPASTIYVKEEWPFIVFTTTWQFDPTKEEFVHPNKRYKT